ncbi:MAG: hypothetical protein RLZZ435_118 [Cyanobacteriota bacterium]|jgi:hypothetical protein
MAGKAGIPRYGWLDVIRSDRVSGQICDLDVIGSDRHKLHRVR